MAHAPLTVDVALDLLDEYADEEAISIDFVGDEATDVAALSLSQDHPQNPQENRFKRAREAKKNELVYFRTQVSGLERVLRLLKQQQRRQLSDTRPSAWQVAALRQEQERREAELLNTRLRAMVQATVKRARQLKSLLSVPDSLSDLVHHKRLSQHDAASFMVDAIELQSVILAVNLLETQVATARSRLRDESEALKSRRDGCRLLVELEESNVLPYSFKSVCASAWHLLTVGDATSIVSRTESKGVESSQVTRLYTMQLVSGSRSIAYRDVYVYRKRVDDAGRLVISWASSWIPSHVSDSDSWEEGHESFRREGFVVVLASSDDTCASRVQVFHRVERDACSAHSCNKGAWGYATAKQAQENVAGCVASEIKTFFQALENQIVMRGAHNKH